jgi:hypothetical protein
MLYFAGIIAEKIKILDYFFYFLIYSVVSDDMCRVINLLKTKRNLNYIRNQSVPRSRHSTTVIKTIQLMMYKAKIAVCSEIRTK